MKKSALPVLVVFSLLLALFIQQSITANRSKDIRFSFFSDEEPESILLTPGEGAFPLYFSRESDGWRLELDSNLRYPVNTTRFDAFLKELTAQRNSTDTGVTDHHIYSTGDKSVFIIEVLYRNGNSARTLFGSTSADESQRYFSSGNKVFRTDNRIGRFLDGRTASWVHLQPFDTVFEKTALQRAVLVQNDITHNTGKDALTGLQRALRAMYCVDITNIPGIPDTTLILELGNLNTITIEFLTISDEYAIMTEDVYRAAWIIPVHVMEKILEFFPVRQRS